jgi:tetratricopeptide (TPR) repeat protein
MEISNRGLTIRAQDLELEHLITSVDLLKQQQELKEAKSLFINALSRSEKKNGFESAATLRIALHFARFLSNIKDSVSEALELFQRSCDGHDIVCGHDHAETIHAWHDFGRFLARLNRYQTAKTIFQRVMKGCLETYGEEHDYTLNTMNNLASTLRKIGDLMAAKTLYEKAWRISDKRKGSFHSLTLMYKSNLRRVNEAIVSIFLHIFELSAYLHQ